MVEDHRYLCEGKQLRVTIAPASDCEVVAPVAIVQAAIGNLLRNAIEKQRLWRDRAGGDAFGHGHHRRSGARHVAEDISAIYTRMARDSARDGGGIGLELIARLCEHWAGPLTLDSGQGRGTTVTLDMSASTVDRMQAR